VTSPTRPTPAYPRYTSRTGSGSFPIVEPAVSRAAVRRLRVAALLVLAMCVLGIFACDFLVASGIGDDEPTSLFGFLRPYALHEPPFLWLLGGFVTLVWLGAGRWGEVGAPMQRPSAKSLIGPALLAAAVVVLVTGAGALTVMHSAGGVAAFANPLLAAISTLSLAGASARLWPGELRRGRLAILYLATSTQFLLVSMTPAVWAAHLSLNLLWLYLVLRDDRAGLGVAPWVGVTALAVQSPLPHALFAAPFLFRVLRTGRVGWIAYYGAVYGAGIVALEGWRAIVPADAVAGRSLGAMLHTTVLHGMNLSTLLTWQAPAMALFLVAALLLVRSLKPAERDLLAGVVLTFGFFMIFPEADGHAWGYRRAYPVLGSAALLAASATATIATQRGGALVSRLVMASTALALLVQLPLRAVQAERTTHPRVAPSILPDTPAPTPPSATTTPRARRR
jgi:hypothetical protein